jgi:hypothetical protein
VSSTRCTTTSSTTSGLHQVHQSLADHVDWHRTGSLSPKPSSTPCCGTAQLSTLTAPGPLFYILCPRRTTVGVPAEIELLNHSRPLSSRHIHDCSYQLSSCCFFSKTDLLRACNQMQSDSCPFWPYTKNRHHHSFWPLQVHFMSFCMRNTAQKFQRFMDDILLGLNLCLVCLDYILVFSRSLEEYEWYLRALSTGFRRTGFW